MALAEDGKPANEPFLRRWSRRKKGAAAPAADASIPEAEVRAASAGGAALPTATDGEAITSEVDLDSLPDIDSLDESSDFSVFMQNGIPDALRTRALQKLWRLDPVFGHVDGLLEYGEDFTGAGLAAEAVNTIYKVGKGVLSGEEKATPAPTAVVDADVSSTRKNRMSDSETPGTTDAPEEPV